MNNKRFLAAVLGLIFAGLLMGCGEVNDTGTGPDQASKLEPRAISSSPFLPHVITWASVSAGDNHTCGIDGDNAYLWCWGDNLYGQLGNGGTADKKTPAWVVSSTWLRVAPGGRYTCGIKSANTLWCWGFNGSGQLGDGTTGDKLTPSQDKTGDSDWASLDSGYEHSCALKTDQSLWCWGGGDYGQLGNGTTAGINSAPQQVGTKAWKSFTAGAYHTCAVRTDGTLWCWGSNINGQLGIGSHQLRKVPAKVGADANWSSVGGGWYHTCAIKKDKSLWCWGLNQFGELGNGTTKSTTKPVRIGTDNSWKTVALGTYHSCGLKKNTGLYCWGHNDSGQLDNSDYIDRHKPKLVGDAGTGYVSFAAGSAHTCGVWNNAGTHEIWCWGNNDHGQLGNGNTVTVNAPVQVINP